MLHLYYIVMMMAMQHSRQGMANAVVDSGDVDDGRCVVRATDTTNSRLLGVRLSTSRPQHQRSALRDTAEHARQVSGHAARRREEATPLLGRASQRDLH